MSDETRMKSFENALDAIQKEEDLSCQLGSKVSAITSYYGGAIVGLANGKVIDVVLGESITVKEMTSEKGGHSAVVSCLALTADRSRVVSGSWDRTVRVYNLAERKEECKFEGHNGAVFCLAITPDALRVVSGSSGGEIRIYNLAERREECKFEAHSNDVNCLAITPDGSRVVSGSCDSTVRIYNFAEQREESKFEGHTESVSCVAITPDGSRVVSGSRDNTVRIYNIAEQREESKFEGHIMCLAITPDGERVISDFVSNLDVYGVVVYNLKERREEYKFERDTKEILCLAITPDGSRVVSSSKDNTVQVYNLANRREELKFEGHTGDIRCLAITQDGSRVISGSWDMTVRVYNLMELREEFLFDENLYLLDFIEITPDESRIISSSHNEEETKVSVYNLAQRRWEFEIFFDTTSINFLEITPDGSRVVFGCNNGEIRVYNLAEQIEEFKFEKHNTSVNDLKLTPDGLRVVSSLGDNTVRVYNLAERREEFKFEGHTDTVEYVAITPDGSRVVSSDKKGEIRVYNLTERREECKFEGYTDAVFRLAITPDGSRVVSCDKKGEIRVYNLAERREEYKFEGHSESVYCLAITPDGSRVVLGLRNNGKIWVYNLAEQGEEFKFEGHTDDARSLAITPDGLRVLSGDNNGKIWVYNIAERREEFQFEGYTQSISRLAITPDGSRVVSSSLDCTVRVYNLIERREESKLEGYTGFAFFFKITQNGSKVVSVAWDNKVRVHNLTDISFNYRRSGTIQRTLKSNEMSPTPSYIKYSIEFWKNGNLRSLAIAKYIHPSLLFNALHVFAHFNQSKCLETSLKDGAPLIRGVFGSPLSIALQRNAIKCTDVILQHFIDLHESDQDCWAEFRVINDDLPDLLACPSSLLEPFFGMLMYTPHYFSPLPDFIKPQHALPVTIHIASRLIEISDFHNKDAESSDVLVKFHISLPRWNLTAGSAQSIELLSAFANCENKLILTSPYVLTVIEEKWDNFYAFTLSVTFAYFLLLANICCLLYIDWSSYFLIGCFLSLNTFFALYELAQLIATGREYLADYWNWLDGVRSSLSTLWAIFLLLGYNPVQSEDMKRLTLIAVVLCFIRGFTYFRSFKMTRIFVYMTLAVVKEMYSFLVILGYSVLSFGIFSSILLEIDTIWDAWANGYNLLMGNFDNTSYQTVEWVIFTGATVINVVIMLNLLISILGEAYEKTQMSIRENDLHLQLSVILEYEWMMFWRRRDNSTGTVIVTCKKAEDVGETPEWSGQILQITQTIQTALENNFTKTDLKSAGLEKKIEEKITGLEGKVAGLEGKIGEQVTELKGNIEEKVTGLEGKVTGLEGKIDEKIAGLEGQLQAILGLLQAKG